MPLIRAWRAIWDGEVPVARYVPLRIGVGVMFAFALATALPHASVLYDAALGLPAALTQSTRPHWGMFDTLSGAAVPSVIGLGIVSALLFAGGIAPRVFGVVAYLVHFGLQDRNGMWADGSDTLLRCLLFFLLLAPLGRRAGTAPVWPLRLLQIQIAVVYLATAIYKHTGSDWVNGNALYWVLSDARYMRFPTDLLVGTAAGQTVLRLATWGTLALEYALPVLLLWPRTRRWGIVLGCSLHLGILLLMRIGLYTPVMLVAYLAFVTLPLPPRRAVAAHRQPVVDHLGALREERP